MARTFVGREAELERLRAISTRVALDARPHLVTVVGDAGVGKTSLLAAFQERARDVRWLTGRCPPWGRAVTYRPLGDHLRSCLGLAPDAAPEVVTARLAGREALAPLLGLPAAPELESWEVKARLRRAWVAFLEEIRAAGPVTLIVEDLHWAEDALLDLLASTVRDVNGPLLVVATARPELIGRPGGWGEDHATMSTIRLEPLSRAEAQRMLAELTGGLPAQARDAILARAEGSPLFVEELLHSLVDGGVLRREDGGWTVTGPPGRLEVPPTVQAVLAARIDSLPGLEKRALQAASVVGRAFSERAVRELVGAEPAFGLLEQRDFVRRRPAGEREHVFKHELTRAVAYASLTSARRARLHAAFAGWLEAQDPGGDRHAPVLAHHYAEAAAPDAAELAWGEDPAALAALRTSAVRWLRRAGEQAAARHEMNDAAALFRQATGFEAAGPARADLWRAVARASEQAFGMDAFRDALEHVIELVPPGRDRAQLYADLAMRGSNPGTWSRPPSRDTVERWIARALDEGGADAGVRGMALLGRVNLDPATTAAAAEEALAIARSPGHGGMLGPAYRQLAQCATATGRLEDARRWVDHELAIPPELADRSERSLWYMDATFVYLRAGHVAEALRFAHEHEMFASRLSPHHHVHAVGTSLLVRTAVGDWDEAGRLAARAEAAAEANRDTLCDLNWRTRLVGALVMARLGAADEASRLADEAARTIPAHFSLAQEPALLRMALLRDDLDETRHLLDADPGPYAFSDVDYGPARLDGLAAVGDRGRVEAEAPFVLRAGGYGEPFALRALGRVRDDRALVARAAERFTAMGLEWHARETRARLTEVATAP